MKAFGPLLGDVVRLGDDTCLKEWGADTLDGEPIAAVGDLSGAVYDLVCAGLGDRPRIHPSAYVSPLANVGEDVVIGPGAAIYEYSTVRGRTVISRNVHVGYGCEISRSVIGQNSELSHRATVCCSVIGQRTYFAVGLVTAVCLLSNPDMLRPSRPVHFALPNGQRVSTGQPKWGALIGDDVRTGIGVAIGPGAVIGARTVLHAGVTVTTAWIPPDSFLSLPATGYQIEPRSEGVPS
ncbi:hypothetical protein [Streptomyces sp. NPDC053726]|uniref:hypothetical protein n=1 Tax=Streptomyces sp. NPDC053726 TaxID=3365713 RepID=UPI0037D371FB